MKKRALSAVLWFFSGWFVGAFLAFAVGISPVLAPVLAISASALIAGDPGGRIWGSKQPPATTALTSNPNPA